MEKGYHSLSEGLMTGEQAWRAAEHILGVTFPVVQDPKLLLRALEHLEKAARNSISVVLKREYVYKRVRLSQEGKQNLEVFFETCAQRYGLMDEDIQNLKELLDLGRRHKASGVEFSQKGKAVILDDDIGTVTISLAQMQKLAAVTRKLQLEVQASFKKYGEFC